MKRELFQTHLRKLEEELNLIAGMAATSIITSTASLLESTEEEAKRVIAEDSSINSKRYQIEEHCVTLIATQQPVATDLREIIAIMSIITDIERIADFAKSNAKIALQIKGPIGSEHGNCISVMSELVLKYLEKSILAFLKRDISEIKLMILQDREINKIHKSFSNEIIEEMSENPGYVSKGWLLTHISYNFKRIAEHITNICERVEYLVNGQISYE